MSLVIRNFSIYDLTSTFNALFTVTTVYFLRFHFFYFWGIVKKEVEDIIDGDILLSSSFHAVRETYHFEFICLHVSSAYRQKPVRHFC